MVVVRWKTALTDHCLDTITVCVGEAKINGSPSGGLCSTVATKEVTVEQSHSVKDDKERNGIAKDPAR